MSRINLKEYITRELTSCKLWVPFRLGGTADHSGSALKSRSISGSPKFVRGRHGWAFCPNGAGSVDFADHADFNLDVNDLISIVAFAELCTTGAPFQMLDSYNAGGFSFQIASTNKLQLAVDGGTLQSWLSDVTLEYEAHMFAGVVQDWPSATQVTATTYLDGVVHTAQATKNVGGSATIARSLYIGCNNARQYADSGHIYDVMFFDDALTETQLGNIRELWSHAAKVGQVRPKGRRIWPVKADTTALVQLASAQQGGVVEDLSNTGHQATVGPGCMTGILAPSGRAFQFDQDVPSELTVADAADLQDTPMTAMAWIKTTTLTAVQRWMAKGDPTAGKPGKAGWACGLNTDGDLIFSRDYDIGGGSTDLHTQTSTAPVAVVGEWVHVAVTYTPGTVSPLDAAKLYANGALVASTEVDPTASGQTSDAGEALTVGNDDSDTLPFQGLIADARFYDSELTAADIYAIYLQGAKARFEERHEKAFPEYVVLGGTAALNKTCGAYRVGAGSFKFSDSVVSSVIRRAYSGNGAGWLYKEQHQAFGSWHFKIIPADADVTYFIPAATAKGAFGSFTGYALSAQSGGGGNVILWVSTPAVIISTGVTLVQGTEYEILLTRSRAQGWEIWIKGGAWSDWTSLGTGTENTYTTSAFEELDMDAGGTSKVFAEMSHFVGGYVDSPADLGL